MKPASCLSNTFSELGLQRIEAQYSLLLSRQLGTPNITSKGKLLPRNVLVPLALYPSEHPLHEDTNNTKKPLVEELEPRTKLVEDISNKLKLVEEVETKSKGILKSGPVTTQKKECPKFEWVKEGDKLKITVHVPKLVGFISILQYVLMFMCYVEKHAFTQRYSRSRIPSNHPRRRTILFP